MKLCAFGEVVCHVCLPSSHVCLPSSPLSKVHPPVHANRRWRMGRPLRAAASCRRAIRKEPAVRNIFAVSLVALGACLPFLRLMTTKASSFEEADPVCRERLLVIVTEVSNGMDDEGEAAEYLEFTKSSAATTSGHLTNTSFNNVSAWFSLACFLTWMFVTPHTSSSETRLDLQRASA